MELFLLLLYLLIYKHKGGKRKNYEISILLCSHKQHNTTITSLLKNAKDGAIFRNMWVLNARDLKSSAVLTAYLLKIHKKIIVVAIDT